MEERFVGAVCCQVFFVRGGFKDTFEDIYWFSNEHLEKCRAILVVADSVVVFYSEFCGYAVFFASC